MASSRDIDGRHVAVVEVCASHSHGLVDPDQIVEGASLPVGRETLAREFIHHLETGEPLHRTPDMYSNLEAMAIPDAAVRSASSGKMELVNNTVWCIG